MNYYIIPPLVSSLLFISLGIFVLFNKKRSIVNVAYFLSCLATFWWQFSWVFLFSTREPHISTILVRLGYTGIVFIPITLYHFYMSFLDNETDRKRVKLAYLIGFLFTISIWFSNYFVQGYYEYFWGFYPRAGILHPFYLVFLGVIDIRILYLLARHLISNREKSSAIYSQTKYLFLGLMIYSFAATDFLVNYGIEFYPLGFIAILMTLSITAYAITKTRLMDISVIISKSIAYGLTMVILGIGYLLFVIPYRLYISPAIDIGFISLSIAYGIFTGFAFERLRMFIQTSSDKVFLKGRYDFTDTLAGISEALSSIVSLRDFYDFLEKMRLDYIEASSLKVYIPGDQSQQIEHSLVEFLSRSKKIFHLSELPKDIAGSVNKAKIELLVPCFAKGKLAAILFVGRKLSEDPYREEEIDVFKVLAPQIATVIERVKPYEKVKEDYAAAQILADSAQKAAERAQNMAILGQIALQAGHEIKNPVAAINIHTELLTKHVGDAEHIGKYIELVKRNSKKIEDIVDKMKQFGTTKTEEKKPVDIAEIMNDRVLFLLEGYIKKKEIKVENNIGSHPKIMGDESSLEKAFVNIILNSIEAMDAGGMLSVSSHTEDKKIVIKIKDTGCGISKDDLDKIFLPMFTTKHEGTGLGLSIAYKTIVTDHGGSIDVKCEEGKGTEFTVTLPVS